jgi:hypothetical protein
LDKSERTPGSGALLPSRNFDEKLPKSFGTLGVERRFHNRVTLTKDLGLALSSLYRSVKGKVNRFQARQISEADFT